MFLCEIINNQLFNLELYMNTAYLNIQGIISPTFWNCQKTNQLSRWNYFLTHSWLSLKILMSNTLHLDPMFSQDSFLNGDSWKKVFCVSGLFFTVFIVWVNLRQNIKLKYKIQTNDEHSTLANSCLWVYPENENQNLHKCI